MNRYRLCFRQMFTIWALLTVLLTTSGCSGITPDGQLRNNREEGPESGLFSGPDGEFVILAPGSGSDQKTTTKAGDTATGSTQ